MKVIKTLLILFAGLILIAIGMVSIFAVTFDSNQYKQELSELVKSQTGRELLFKGDIGLTLYPSLGMKLGSMTFSNAPGFGNEPMLAVNNASVSVDVLSILSFEPHIAELVLDGLNVNLQKNKQGVTNWDDLLTESDSSSTDPATEDETASDQQSDGISLKAAFDGLAISDVNLLWSDAQAATEYQVHIASLLTGKIMPETTFPLQLNMTVQSLNELSSTIALKTKIWFNGEKLTLTGLQLDSTAQGELVPVDKLSMRVSGDVGFSLVTNKLSVSAFNTTIETSGGVLDSSETTVSGEIGFDLNQQQLTIGYFDIQSSVKGPSVPDSAMDVGMSATKLDLQLNKRSVDLQQLVLTLNDNQFKGYLSVLDYAQPNIKFSLKSERFDVDKLLGESESKTIDKPVDEEVAVEEDIEIKLPMELLRSLKLDGKLEVASLMVQGLTLNNVLLKLDADKGLVKVDPLKMDLYDGSYAGAVIINAQQDKPVYSVKQKLSSFQVGQFLQDFMGDDKLSGNANLDMDLSTGGEWLSKLKSNLNGDISVLVKDGALKGFNLRHKIESARAKLRRDKEPELVERKTDFSALSLSGVIKNGVLKTDDLDLQAPLIRVGGNGSVDLAEEMVDYLVNAKMVTTSKGQQGGSADELSGLAIPVAITGSWLSPKIDVQLDEMLKARLNAEKARISQSIAKQKAQLKKTLDAEKAKLKLSQQKQADAKKKQLQKKQALAEAEQKAKLDAAKQKKQAELDAKKAAEKAKAKKKLEDKLKKLF